MDDLIVVQSEVAMLTASEPHESVRCCRVPIRLMTVALLSRHATSSVYQYHGAAQEQSRRISTHCVLCKSQLKNCAIQVALLAFEKYYSTSACLRLINVLTITQKYDVSLINVLRIKVAEIPHATRHMWMYQVFALQYIVKLRKLLFNSILVFVFLMS